MLNGSFARTILWSRALLPARCFPRRLWRQAGSGNTQLAEAARRASGC